MFTVLSCYPNRLPYLEQSSRLDACVGQGRETIGRLLDWKDCVSQETHIRQGRAYLILLQHALKQNNKQLIQRQISQ